MEHKNHVFLSHWCPCSWNRCVKVNFLHSICLSNPGVYIFCININSKLFSLLGKVPTTLEALFKWNESLKSKYRISHIIWQRLEPRSCGLFWCKVPLDEMLYFLYPNVDMVLTCKILLSGSTYFSFPWTANGRNDFQLGRHTSIF